MSRVKPLEWSELSDGWITHTPFGSYEVNGSVLRGRLGTCYDYFSSEHAKVAAQADYEQRILSTLKPEGEQMDVWQRIAADPELANARRKLSIHEIRLIIKHAKEAV